VVVGREGVCGAWLAVSSGSSSIVGGGSICGGGSTSGSIGSIICSIGISISSVGRLALFSKGSLVGTRHDSV
jgi:hypothetical protein